jgi:hypothetical protein
VVDLHTQEPPEQPEVLHFEPAAEFLLKAAITCSLPPANAMYGCIGQQSGSGFSDLAPSMLHYNWF